MHSGPENIFRIILGIRIISKSIDKTKLITGFQVTPANIADNHMADPLLDKKEDGGQPLHGDSAYSSKELEELYKRKNIISKVNKQSYRYKALTKEDRKENKKNSK